MPYNQKIVLFCENGYKSSLDLMVQKFIKDKVVFIGVVGKDCEKVEDIINELIVGEGVEGSPCILTSSHKGKSVDQAVNFAESLTGEFSGKAQVVNL